MKEKNLVIRVATAEDAPAIGTLSTQLGYPASTAKTADRLRRVLEAPGHGVFVAGRSDHEIIGWIHVFGTVRVESDGFAELGGLVVAENWRGRGAGTLLVDAAETWASGSGYLRLRIRSRADRAEAHGFFERLGFAGCKTQRVFERSLAGDP